MRSGTKSVRNSAWTLQKKGPQKAGLKCRGLSVSARSIEHLQQYILIKAVAIIRYRERGISYRGRVLLRERL